MNKTDFTIDDIRKVLSELFDVGELELDEEYDLSTLIKDSIDLGELVAILKQQYAVEPKDWDGFKTKTTLKEVFNNFE
jgi:acyl carrier protein